MAEAILGNRLLSEHVLAGARSAGTRAVGGPADPLAQKVLAARGLDLSRHESASLDLDTISAATLILAMERAHIAAIVTMMPGALAKTFGLTEVVALCQSNPTAHIGEPIQARLAQLHVQRRPMDVLSAPANFDIADPHGGRLRDYERCADHLTHLINLLVPLLWDPGNGTASG